MNGLPFDGLITIRWDQDEGCVVWDIGELDYWSAEAMIRQVANCIYDEMPEPRNINAQVDDEP